MKKQEVKKMIVKTFEEFYSNAIKSFKGLENNTYYVRSINETYKEVNEKMYGYVIGVIDLYTEMTKNLRSKISDEFYPIYKEYKEKLWNASKEYKEKHIKE